MHNRPAKEAEYLYGWGSCIKKDQMVHIYRSTICPTVEYACQVWHSSLTKKLSEDLELVETRACP